MTQLEKIRNELIRNNKVYRNWCLSWRCTRKEYKEIEKFNEEHNFNLNGKVVKNSEVQSRFGFSLPPVRE